MLTASNNFRQYISIPNILIYLLIVNLLGVLVMYIDKKRAEYGKWRISENTLLTISIIGGSIGILIGMYWFRHKTKKIKFTLGIPIIIVIQIIIFLMLRIKYFG